MINDKELLHMTIYAKNTFILWIKVYVVQGHSSRKEKYMTRINITRGAWATSFTLETVPNDKILYMHLKVQDAIYISPKEKK